MLWLQSGRSRFAWENSITTRNTAGRETAPAVENPQTLGRRFKQRILKKYCVRFHMSLIVMAVVASGVLSSKLMLMSGFSALWLRYPVAVLCAYGVFLGLVRLWISWVMVQKTAMGVSGGSSPGTSSGVSLDLDGFFQPGNSGGGPFSFGGGDSGGGGASDSWGIGDQDLGSAVQTSTGGSGSSWLPDFDFDFGDDGIWLLVLLALLALVIFFAGGYLVWAAPDILGEAAWQALLGGVMVRARKQARAGWMTGVLKSTVIPFALVLVAASVLGWQAHRHCPKAARLAEVFACVAE